MLSMLRNLFVKKPAPQPFAPCLPPGQRCYAVGDIHGELSMALALVEQISEDHKRRGDIAETHLIFLGDFIDRGPQSRETVEWLASYPPTFATSHFLRGNHEDAFLAVLDGDESDLIGWRKFGGRETLASYGIGDKAVAMGGPFFRGELREKVPESHILFLRSLKDYVQLGDYLFVHAGIRPGVALSAQDPRDFTWIRKEFIDSSLDHGLMIVHGHTISAAVDIQPNRIGIDTGAYQPGGKLSAIGLEGEERWFLEVGR
jgi:serine/threonine protein phosphatase 1